MLVAKKARGTPLSCGTEKGNPMKPGTLGQRDDGDCRARTCVPHCFDGRLLMDETKIDGSDLGLWCLYAGPSELFVAVESIRLRTVESGYTVGEL